MSQNTDGIHSVLSISNIYELLQNAMGAHKGYINFVDEFVRPNQQSRILDIGCGTGRILDYLPYGVDYSGVDISAQYIQTAKTRYLSRGKFYCGFLDEIAKTEKFNGFDVLLMIGVLHHLDDSVAEEILKVAKVLMLDGGRLITIDPCFAPNQNLFAKALIKLDRGKNVRTAILYENLAKKSFPHVNGELRHRHWIPYTHWIMECSF